MARPEPLSALLPDVVAVLVARHQPQETDMTEINTPSADPLVAHYVKTVRLIEHLLLSRIPRLPLLPQVTGLVDVEVDAIARRLAEAHTVAADVAP